MRQVLEASEAGDRDARLALDIASYRLAKYIGAYHVAVDGADANTFTAGIGENSAQFRARVLDRLGVLGVKADAECHIAHAHETRLIATEDSAIAVPALA